VTTLSQATSGLRFTLCLQSDCTCFYGSQVFVFIIETKCVYCAVQTEFLNVRVIQVILVLKSTFFLCQYHSTGVLYSFSLSTCFSYQQDKRVNPGNLPESNALSENGVHWVEEYFSLLVLKVLNFIWSLCVSIFAAWSFKGQQKGRFLAKASVWVFTEQNASVRVSHLALRIALPPCWLLLTVRNYKVRRCGGLQWYGVRASFRENQSTGSKVEVGKTSTLWSHQPHFLFSYKGGKWAKEITKTLHKKARN
jgi:hypothetical protein